MHGTGSCKYPATESEYTGQWVDNKRQGQGCMQFGDSGAVYEGAYCKGQMHGQVGGRGQGGVCSNLLTAECTPRPPQGTYTWKDGSYYCGEFSHDKQHGAGTYHHAKVAVCAHTTLPPAAHLAVHLPSLCQGAQAGGAEALRGHVGARLHARRGALLLPRPEGTIVYCAYYCWLAGSRLLRAACGVAGRVHL